MCLLASANGFVSLFVALELFSIALYVLCALDVHDEASLESGLKYLVTGSVGSAALLFGSGLAYIATGSLRFDEIGKALSAGGSHTGILLLGIALIVAGLAFKASCGSVPHVDARRLRGRADGRDGVHGDGHEDDRARDAAARHDDRLRARRATSGRARSPRSRSRRC